MTTNILTTLVIQPDKLEYALDYLKKMKADTQANEPGVVFYQSYWYEDRPNEIIVVEIFKDEAAKEFHLERHAYRREDFNYFNAEPEVLRMGIEV